MIKDSIQDEILINSDSASVWDALTNSEKTKIYMYGCDALTDWKVGSELHWEGSYEGKKMVFVSGHVLSIDQPNSLAFTVIDPNAKYEQTRENHLVVLYKLMENENGVLLTVTQSGFKTVADGDNRYKDVYNNGAGWKPVLEKIKEICEKI